MNPVVFIPSSKKIFAFSVVLILMGAFFFTQNSNSYSKAQEEKEFIDKESMLEEMYKQWKEILQDPNGDIPAAKGYAAWQQAGSMMRQQQKGQLLTSLTSLNWESRGPSNVGGRTRTLLVSPNDVTGNTVFAGSVGGGIWKCTNIKSSAASWAPVNDFMENLSIATITYDPSNTMVFYAGTGEGFNNSDACRGFGIFKSVDGGNSWAILPNTQNSNFYYVNKMVVTSTGRVVAATGSGIRYSDDGGATWILSQSGNFGDLEKSADGSLFAASTGSNGPGIYKSTNGGVNWILANGGVPTGYRRYELATAPSDAAVVYAMVYNSPNTTFYKSTDGGNSYTAISSPVDSDTGISSTDVTRGQGWYDLILKVDPNNANTVYCGGIDLFKSTNGGSSWLQISHWYGGFGFQNVHADQHYIEFEGTNSNIMYFTNDGGVFQSTNATNTTPTITAKINNYNVTQFYGCAMHPSSGSNFFIAGAQDNGTQRFAAPGYGNTTQASGGDGAYCNIDQLNPTYMYSQYVYNNYYRSINGGSSFSSISNAFSNTGRFINPTTFDNNTKALYGATSGGMYLRWSNAHTSSNFEQIAVSALGTQVVSALTMSPITANRLYLGTGNGQIVEVDNASTATGIVPGRSLGTPASGYIRCIWQDPSNADRLIIIFSGYGQTNIYETINASAAAPTWTAKDGNLPDMPVLWVLPHPDLSTSSVLLATEFGVWSTDNFNSTSPSWVISSNGLARVRVTQLHYRPSDKTVVASTHGRGLYTTILNNPTSCNPPVNLSSTAITSNTATVNWDAVSGAASYDVDYKLASSGTWINAATGTLNTSLELGGLTENSQYDWRVRANCSLPSAYSGAQFTTQANCTAPTGLSSSSITTNSAIVSWAAVAAASSYDVDYKQTSSSIWTVAASATASTSISLTGLLNATAYDWRVRARCSSLSAFAQSNFTTLAPPVCTDPNESNNTSGTATVLSSGVVKTGSIGSSSDVDWYKINIGNSSSTKLKVTLSNLPADYDLFVYNKSLVQVAAGTNTGSTSEVVIYNSNTKRTTYFIKVQPKLATVFDPSICYNLVAQLSANNWTGVASGLALEEPDVNSIIKVFPNPVHNQLFIQYGISKDGDASIRLLNARGMIQWEKTEKGTAGLNRRIIDVGKLTPGFYFIQISTASYTQVEKLVIVH